MSERDADQTVGESESDVEATSHESGVKQDPEQRQLNPHEVPAK
jgi:hypothetical protein